MKDPTPPFKGEGDRQNLSENPQWVLDLVQKMGRLMEFW